MKDRETMQGKRGSIALARQLCYEIAGATSEDDMDGGGYGSVDVAEILSAEVVRLREALAQPEQQAKPVAYLCENAVGHKYFRWKKPSDIHKPICLYTAPPQRPWVGVTEKDWEYVKDKKGTSLDSFDQGAAWAADQLMRRNT